MFRHNVRQREQTERQVRFRLDVKDRIESAQANLAVLDGYDELDLEQQRHRVDLVREIEGLESILDLYCAGCGFRLEDGFCSFCGKTAA